MKQKNKSIMDLKNKNILVLGYGSSGQAVCKYLSEKSAKIWVYDDMVETDPYPKVTEYFSFSGLDLCICSPGFSKSHKIFEKINKSFVPCIGELEFASLNFCGKLIAITGTNGKSTVTSLLGAILQNAKLHCKVCGNIGLAFTQILSTSKKNTIAVVEASSFQLDSTFTFKPDIAVLLDITPDHLDEHKSFQMYIEAKQKIFKNQSINDYLITSQGSLKYCNNVKSKVVIYPCNNGAYDKNEYIYWKKRKIMCVHDVPLLGNGNLQNVLACVTVAKLLKIKNKIIANSIKNFKPLPHRLQPIGIKRGVLFINDSKSTTPESTDFAVKAVGGSPILLLGGKDKNLDYSIIFENKNVKDIIAFGESSQKISQTAKEFGKDIMLVDNLTCAVVLAMAISNEGDVILLSPACSSFDQFQNFEKRGEKFIDIYENL
ncbi:MAG: UDP-N-acetylmuramoyl-L-alanine--D-glutamate ligase [Clostridia bacterium]